MEMHGDFNGCYNGLLKDSLLTVLAEDLLWKQPPHTIHRTPRRFQNDTFFAWAKRGTIGSPSTGEYARWLESCSRSMAFHDFGEQQVPWQKDVIRHYGLGDGHPRHICNNTDWCGQICIGVSTLHAHTHTCTTCVDIYSSCSLDGGLACICQLLEVSLKLLIAFIAALDVSTVSCTFLSCDGEFTGILGVEQTPFTSEDQPLGTKALRIWPGERSKKAAGIYTCHSELLDMQWFSCQFTSDKQLVRWFIFAICLHTFWCHCTRNVQTFQSSTVLVIPFFAGQTLTEAKRNVLESWSTNGTVLHEDSEVMAKRKHWLVSVFRVLERIFWSLRAVVSFL